ncbi:restriction endonuclease [Geopseudomonas aromaticivorans]
MDALIDLSMTMPLWLNIILAIAAYWFLQGYSFDAAANPQLGRAGASSMVGPFFYSIAAIGKYLLPGILICGGLLGALVRARRAKDFQRIAEAKSRIEAIRSLSWKQFEQMIGEALRRQGYSVTETVDGPDGGVDLVLFRGDQQFLVQCKHWNARKVPVQVVRELYGVMAARKAAGGLVVTTGEFTRDAQAFAKDLKVDLIDGQGLLGWFGPVSAVAEPVTVEKKVVPHAPICPRCCDVMVSRFAKSDGTLNARRAFWGCTKFPRCRGTRQMD